MDLRSGYLDYLKTSTEFRDLNGLDNRGVYLLLLKMIH